MPTGVYQPPAHGGWPQVTAEPLQEQYRYFVTDMEA